MNHTAKISIITPSFNQGPFIEETIRSVINQNYSNYEHIVVDGGSTDKTTEILQKYPHLKIIREPDRGQAEAVNKGLRIAGGEIIGWLNSDDTYYPGIFRRVNQEINPEMNRYIVMGRCAYMDETGHLTGFEHASIFKDHKTCVKIWRRGNTIPQPAVFFHRSVYEEYGGLDEDLYFALDYDLFLRYSQKYYFFCVNELWATYRIHSTSKTNEIYLGELMERSVEVSKRYWGSIGSTLYWEYFTSYLLHGGRLGIISYKRLNKARRYLKEKKIIPFAANILVSVLLFPPTIIKYALFPLLENLWSRRRVNI